MRDDVDARITVYPDALQAIADSDGILILTAGIDIANFSAATPHRIIRTGKRSTPWRSP